VLAAGPEPIPMGGHALYLELNGVEDTIGED
jgi:hypothetical protein